MSSLLAFIAVLALLALLMVLVASLAALVGWLARRIARGVRGPVVMGLGLGGWRARSGRPAPKVPRLVCARCGAPKRLPSERAWVTCDRCAALVGFDFELGLADGGAATTAVVQQALRARQDAALRAAQAAGDRARCSAIHARLAEEFAAALPGACPPRIADPEYRRRWVDWSAEAATAIDFDPACTVALAEETLAVGSLVWDRSVPLRLRVETASFRRVWEAGARRHEAVLALLEREGRIASFPEIIDLDLFRRSLRLSLLGSWWPHLDPAEAAALQREAGLDVALDTPEPVATAEAVCPGCDRRERVHAEATHAICHACGRLFARGAGAVPPG